MTGLADKLLTVAVKALLDVLHDLHLKLLSEVELSEYLLLPPYWCGPLFVVELVLYSPRLESLCEVKYPLSFSFKKSCKLYIDLQFDLLKHSIYGTSSKSFP